MGRRSKLTDVQWEKLHKELLLGASMGQLAKQYGVSKQLISLRFAGQSNKLKDVAKQIVETEKAVNNLTLEEQRAVSSIVNDLRIISRGLAGAAANGAITSLHLSSIAMKKAQEINCANMDSAEDQLRQVAQLTRTANEAAAPGQQILGLAKNQALATEEDKTDKHVHRIELVGLD